jgi:hypothetical protein
LDSGQALEIDANVVQQITSKIESQMPLRQKKPPELLLAESGMDMADVRRLREVEGLNGKFRDDARSEHWFGSLAEAPKIFGTLRADISHRRPHSAHGNQTPA